VFRSSASARCRASARSRLLTAFVVVGLTSACTGRGSPAPSTPRPSPPVITTPSPAPFVFSSVQIFAAPVAAGVSAAARTRAGNAVEQALTGFYQEAFADPSLWGQDLPADAWDVFAPPARSRAAKDAPSLTLGTFGAGVTTLRFTKTDLAVRVLLDQHGHPQGALASVVVRADADHSDGQTVRVANRVTFVLEPNGSRWLIQGYPSATTTGTPIQ
jgi:ketosteroid isomerase-like protein